jgi:hypothetical protein
MSCAKKMVRSSAMVIAAAAALTVAVPVSNAYAIDDVACHHGAGFLKVEGHGALGGTIEACYANAGKQDYWGGIWVTKITTGNNDVVYYDVNGATVDINRWTVFEPTNPVHVKAIEIR